MSKQQFHAPTSPEYASSPEDEAVVLRRNHLLRAIPGGMRSTEAILLVVPGKQSLSPEIIMTREAYQPPTEVDEDLNNYKAGSFTPAEHAEPVEPARIHTAEPIPEPRPEVDPKSHQVQKARDDVEAAFSKQEAA